MGGRKLKSIPVSIFTRRINSTRIITTILIKTAITLSFLANFLSGEIIQLFILSLFNLIFYHRNSILDILQNLFIKFSIRVIKFLEYTIVNIHDQNITISCKVVAIIHHFKFIKPFMIMHLWIVRM